MPPDIGDKNPLFIKVIPQDHVAASMKTMHTETKNHLKSIMLVSVFTSLPLMPPL